MFRDFAISQTKDTVDFKKPQAHQIKSQQKLIRHAIADNDSANSLKIHQSIRTLVACSSGIPWEKIELLKHNSELGQIAKHHLI